MGGGQLGFSFFFFFFFEFMGLFVRIGLVLKIDHVGFDFVLFPVCRSRNSFQA